MIVAETYIKKKETGVLWAGCCLLAVLPRIPLLRGARGRAGRLSTSPPTLPLSAWESFLPGGLKHLSGPPGP